MHLRLKTKLLLAITGMVAAVVLAFASIYIRQIVQQRLSDGYEDGNFVAHQIFDAARQSLETDLTNTRVDLNNPDDVRHAAEDTLQTDPGLNSLMQSIVGYSPTIYDVAIAEADGRALLHTDPNVMSERRLLPKREDFANVVHGNILRQLAIVYGAPRVYEINIPIDRNQRPFGSVRVGISTVLLKSDLRPQLDHALELSGIAIFLSLLLAAALANFALRPLTMIRERLDLMVGDVPEGPEAVAASARDADEVGSVTLKINRIDRRMRDVKEVFSALKENLDQIMANLQDGLVLFTRDARAILVSAAVERFLQRPRGEMLGHNVGEFFFESTPLGHLVLDAFENHQPLAQRELQIEDGRRIQVSLDFIEEQGEQMGALLTLRDSESVRRIESEIELSRRLSAIGRLASGVGHEVNNPINAIVVHLEVLRQKLQQVDPDTRRHLDVISSEIQRLSRVVQELVDFTRPEELRLAPEDLRRTVNDVASLAGPEAERHNVHIACEVPAQPVPVRIDADRFKQALLNVVLNGVQSMPAGGNLRIALETVAGSALVKVCDQGNGIPLDIRDKIYNLYFTTKKTGTGIGLAMTYKVMQLHQGSVGFNSVIGKGTEFTLTLPELVLAQQPPRELVAQG